MEIPTLALSLRIKHLTFLYEWKYQQQTKRRANTIFRFGKIQPKKYLAFNFLKHHVFFPAISTFPTSTEEKHDKLLTE